MLTVKKLNILIVDDHPMVLEACEGILSSLNTDEYTVQIDCAINCDAALNYIRIAAKGIPYDILFLDITLPESSDGKIIDGESLALYAKQLLPAAKIVILTGISENHRINGILKTVNPSGLIIKTDITSSELLTACNTVMDNPPYYSNTVLKFLRNQLFIETNETLDEVNRKIIYHISKGVKTKNLVGHIHLSLSAIEKRKSYIKEVLGVEDGDDAAIVEKAKALGYI
ncbi:response regulator [bacterium]|nr:response regulator [bacterium]